MKPMRPAWQHRLIGTAGVLVYLLAMFTVAFYLSDLVYRAAGWRPSLLVAQLTNSLLGLLFTGLTLGGVSFFFRSRNWPRRAGILIPIIEALERIAQGDFDVRLDKSFTGHEDAGIFGDLVESVNNMAEGLNQMENLRQEFISNVSHELQSPLTSIRGFAQALRDERLSPQERAHYLNIIETESTRLSRITENLLRLASLEAKQVSFEARPYRLDRQIRGLVLACEPQWTGGQIDMDVNLDEIEITADEDLLSQVWINLIHNSIKFTPPGGRVCVELHGQDGRIDFSIADTGIGITAADQERIFERFYKADPARQRTQEGSGLGLSIAKKIVEMHRGAIGVESTPGVGTVFRVSLPAG
ncbi:MAG: two-component sensor histidine kinase [Chloroflexi bacterium]|nr:two-component sensor histidine kinase [Chloroflexota bacterium]